MRLLLVWACLAFSFCLVMLDLIEGRTTARVLLVCMLLSVASVAAIWS